MKVYLAAPYASRSLIRMYAAHLRRERDMVCTSSWLQETHQINAGTQGAATALPDDQVAKHATDDLSNVLEADVLVLFTSAYVHAEGGGGRHVETGYALALGTPVIVVGEPENVFHRLGAPRVVVVPTWGAALVELDRLESER